MCRVCRGASLPLFFTSDVLVSITVINTCNSIIHGTGEYADTLLDFSSRSVIVAPDLGYIVVTMTSFIASYFRTTNFVPVPLRTRIFTPVTLSVASARNFFLIERRLRRRKP